MKGLLVCFICFFAWYLEKCKVSKNCADNSDHNKSLNMYLYFISFGFVALIKITSGSKECQFAKTFSFCFGSAAEVRKWYVAVTLWLVFWLVSMSDS